MRQPRERQQTRDLLDLVELHSQAAQPLQFLQRRQVFDQVVVQVEQPDVFELTQSHRGADQVVVYFTQFVPSLRYTTEGKDCRC